jgi:hypothetical protein
MSRLALVVVETESLKQCVVALAWCYWDGVFPKLISTLLSNSN